jgi:hypothetical protein
MINLTLFVYPARRGYLNPLHSQKSAALHAKVWQTTVSERPLCATSGQSKFLLDAPGADIFSSLDVPFFDDPAALDLSVGAARGWERRLASIDRPTARSLSRQTFLWLPA